MAHAIAVGCSALSVRRVRHWRSVLLYNWREMQRLAKDSMIHGTTIRRILLAWILLVASVWVAAEPIASLKPTNYVNDFAGVLDAATQTSLNDLCQQVDQKAHAQIAVVTVKSLDGQDAVSYAVALYQKWGIGAKGKDRGVLILLATNDHKYWTSVGYGLEGILPDGKGGRFRAGSGAIAEEWKLCGSGHLDDYARRHSDCPGCGRHLGEPAGVANASPATRPRIGAGAVVVLILVVFFIVLPILRAIFRGGGPGRGGGSGFWSGMLWGMLFSNLGGGPAADLVAADLEAGWWGGLGGGFGGWRGSTGGGGAGGSW